MKVLASGLEWFSDRPGGLPRYFAEYLCAWARHGYQARALVRRPQAAGTGTYPNYVHGLPLDSKNPFQVRRSWRSLFNEELKRDRYDVFNPHFAYYAWAWPMLDAELPVVTHFHGPWAYESSIERNAGHTLRKSVEFQLQKRIEQSVYRRSDRFIVLSHFFRDELALRYRVPRERIHVIPGGVDTDRFCEATDRDEVRRSLNIPEGRFVLLTVRRLVRRMGLDNLIRAIADLRADYPEILLFVVGGGPLHAELTQLVEALSLNDCVRLTNRVPDDVLPLYYQAADLTVVPSSALEGFGFVTVESLASGTPVVGTPVGGTVEILSPLDQNLLFDGTSQADLVAGLARVLQNPSCLPTRLETRRYALIHYTWDTVIPQIRDVFQRAGAAQ